MTGHDQLKAIFESKELIEKISPDFNDLTLDIQGIIDKAQDPAFLAVLLFKLTQERQKTNQLLSEINEKYDKMMFSLKSNASESSLTSSASPTHMGMAGQGEVFEVLSEQDQKILKMAEEKHSLTTEEIQRQFSYKGKNAASQRLNKLVRDGYLKKVKSGKKVLFYPKH